jgi:hypothetical protein
MIELAKTIILTSITVVAYFIASSQGMLLEKVGLYAQKKVEAGYKFFELLICPFCAPTLFSTPVFFAAYALGIINISWHWALLIPFNIFGSSIVSGFTWSAYMGFLSWKERCEAETEYLKIKNE